MAQSGIRFTNGYAAASASTPSRYAMLTGQYAWRRPGTDVATGDAGMIIRPEQFTMADLFKSAGYATAVVGKWHLGLGNETGTQDWNAPLSMYPGDLGFDYSYIMAATADRVPCVFIENGKVSNYDISAPIKVSYSKPFPGEPTAKDNPELLYNLKSSHGHNQAIVNGIGRIGYMKGGGKALWKDENLADSITSHAVDFIKSNRDKPFFLYFATNDVHVPRFPHQRFRGKTNMGLRGDAIVQFDWSVGEIVKTLDKLGLRDNTLIILSSDNGPVVDDGYQDQAEQLLNGHKPAGDLRGAKYSAFEGGSRVPIIVSWPARVEPKQKSDAIVSQIDWLRSFSNLCGISIPKGEAPDSYDFLPVWLGDKKDGRAWVVEQSLDRTLSLRSANWKYIDPSDGKPMVPFAPEIETGYKSTPQLFRMDKIGERDDEANENPELVFRMQELLRKIRKGGVDPFVSPESN